MPSAPNARFPAHGATVLLGLLLVLALAGCSPDDDQSTPEGASGSPATSVPTSPDGSAGGGAEAGGEADGGEGRASVEISAEDRKRTVRGSAPAYVKIRSASLDTAVDRLTMSVELTGRIPRKMPNQKSILRVTFLVSMKNGTRYTFEAQCLRTGWGTFAAGGSDPEYIPELAFSKRRLTMTIDPLYIGGLRPFEWLANVAWTEGDVNYAFDVVPRQGFASYP